MSPPIVTSANARKPKKRGDGPETQSKLARRRITWAALALLVTAPRPARAFEVNGGVSVGGILAGVVPRFAVSPHAGISFLTESGFLFEVHDVCSVLPVGGKLGIGISNETSATLGYASKTSMFSIGPSFSVYAMPACGAGLCGRVVGVSPGGHAQASTYFAGPFGVMFQANVAWMGGSSRVSAGGVAAMVVAGPVLRWRSP